MPNVVMVSAVMLSGITQHAVMLSVIMQNVIMVSGIS